MRITIKDIARQLNVHHSTVSRALRMDSRIKHETGEMIRKYAGEQGYYRNINALRLRGSVRNMIALIVPNINHRFFSNIVNYLTDLAYENNFVLVIYQSNESFNKECSFIKELIKQNVAGVIASVSDKTRSSEHFRELNKMGIPLVFFDRVLTDINASRVTANNENITESVYSGLYRSGRTKIAHITGPEHISVFHDRNRGYEKGHRKNGAGYMKQVIIESEFCLESGKKAAAGLFSEDKRPDAVISTSFFLTLGLVSYLKELNIGTPGEVVIAGFGDRLFNSILDPHIISVEQPEKEMATTAFRLLAEMIEYQGGQESYEYRDVELKSSIVIPDPQSIFQSN